MAVDAVDGSKRPLVAFGACAEHLRSSLERRDVYEWTALLASTLESEKVDP
jgi:hypothetical protein